MAIRHEDEAGARVDALYGATKSADVVNAVVNVDQEAASLALQQG